MRSLQITSLLLGSLLGLSTWIVPMSRVPKGTVTRPHKPYKPRTKAEPRIGDVWVAPLGVCLR